MSYMPWKSAPPSNIVIRYSIIHYGNIIQDQNRLYILEDGSWITIFISKSMMPWYLSGRMLTYFSSVSECLFDKWNVSWIFCRSKLVVYLYVSNKSNLIYVALKFQVLEYIAIRNILVYGSRITPRV